MLPGGLRYDAAEQAFAAVSTAFFDWNEVRVSTVKELAEVMRNLPDPTAAATRLKQSLQSAFEATYAFDLEGMKKQNLGQAVQRLKKFNGTSSFTVGHVTQAALGGHAIPLDRGALDVLYIVGAATEAEVKSAEVTGLERTIPKNKGAEFASLLHQLGAELVAGPYSPNVHKILLEVSAEAKDRLPKRGQKKPVEAPPPKPANDRTADRQKGAAGRREEEGRSQKETGQGCRFFAQGQKRRQEEARACEAGKTQASLVLARGTAGYGRGHWPSWQKSGAR